MNFKRVKLQEPVKTFHNHSKCFGASVTACRETRSSLGICHHLQLISGGHHAYTSSVEFILGNLKTNVCFYLHRLEVNRSANEFPAVEAATAPIRTGGIPSMVMTVAVSDEQADSLLWWKLWKDRLQRSWIKGPTGRKVQRKGVRSVKKRRTNLKFKHIFHVWVTDLFKSLEPPISYLLVPAGLSCNFLKWSSSTVLRTSWRSS